MSFQLRPYQIDALESIHNALQKQSEVLLQAIMGAGKTVIVCRLTNRYYKETDRRFLILAHKQELIEQFEKTFRNMTDIPFYDIGISCAGLNQKDTGKRITIASVQTFVNQADSFGFVNLVVIDEAHRIDINGETQYKKIIDTLKNHNPNLRILGITATPYRLGHGFIYGDRCKEGNINLFPNLTHQIKYEYLRDNHYLMPLSVIAKCTNEMKTDIEKVGKNGDFILNQLEDAMIKEVHIQSVADAINEYCQEFQHICIFCCGIKHAKIIQSKIDNDCTIIHSKLTDLERYQNMQDWKTGKIRIMASVNILIEGFDFPELDCLIMARPTLSTSLFLQAVGRVLRIADGKEKAHLIDLTDNTERFLGKTKSLDNIYVNIPKLTSGNPMLKECPECHTEVHIARMICDCGYGFPPPDRKEGNLSGMKEFGINEPEPPIMHKVYEIKVFRHQKDGKPDSVRIEYHNDNYYSSRICSEWLPFDSEKGAFFARKKWLEMAINKKCIPKTTEEALENQENLRCPDMIEVKKINGYNTVINRIYNDNYNDDIPFDVPLTTAHRKKINDIDDIPF